MKAAEPVTAAWIEEMKGKNIDANELIGAAKSLLAKYETA
jgi:hypothetical protein